MITNDRVSFRKEDLMYPMLLLCLRPLLHLVTAEIDREGLRVSHRYDKCTMRMLVNCSPFCKSFARRLYRYRTSPGRNIRSAVASGVPLFSWHRYSNRFSNLDDHVNTLGATYHRCHRSVPAQSHTRHGKKLFPGLLRRKTRVETLATRLRAGGFSVVEGVLRVHCSGFPHFSSHLPLSFN